MVAAKCNSKNFGTIEVLENVTVGADVPLGQEVLIFGKNGHDGSYVWACCLG